MGIWRIWYIYLCERHPQESSFPFEKFAIKANEATCDILKYGYKLPSNTEFTNNYLTFKNFEFADESINEMLKVGSTKQYLTKPKVIDLLSMLTKGRKRLILDIWYEKGHLYKGKINFGDGKKFQNYLERIKLTCLS